MLRFSLRALLLVVAILCVLAGWLVHRERTRGAAIQAILATGATLDDYNSLSSTQQEVFEYPANSNWTRILQAVTGDADGVVGCRLDARGEFSDDDLRYVEDLPDIKELWLSFSQVTDQGMAYLRSLHHVELLNLDDTAITDDGLRQIAYIRSLEHLSLNHTQITDSGLAHLSALCDLKHLSLEGTSISDAGLDHLWELESLSEVWLFETDVTDEGCAKLQSLLPQCKVIWGDLDEPL